MRRKLVAVMLAVEEAIQIKKKVKKLRQQQ